MIEAGRAYVSANKLFVNGVKDLSQQCKKEEMISVSPLKDELSSLNDTEECLIFILWAVDHIPVNLHISAVVTVKCYKHSCPAAAAAGIKNVDNWRCLKWWFYAAARRETRNRLYSFLRKTSEPNLSDAEHILWE